MVPPGSPIPNHKQQERLMNLIRVIFLGMAVLIPSVWTVAVAGDEAPAEEKAAKKGKKGKKDEKKEEKKAE
jgi:hypothetical protein